VTVAQIAAALKIPELKKRAESTDVEESLSAKRILNTYLGQTTFYLPQSFAAKQQLDRAIFMLELGAEISPASSGLWVEMAAMHARKGKAGAKKALECLRTAVDKGFADLQALESEPAFAELWHEAEFREIVARLSARKGA